MTTPGGQVQIRYPRLTRTIRLFRLAPASGESYDKYAQSVELKNGGVLRYNVEPDIGGGSGGVEGQLKGRLELSGHALVVMCHDQASEGSTPKPEWCVPYLHHLQIDSK